MSIAAKMNGFKPLIPSSKTQTESQYTAAHKRKGFMLNMMKEEFQFSSLLAIGATLNFLLYLVIGQTAFFLAPLLLVVRTADAVLQVYGFRHNPHMDGVIHEKYSAQIPLADGTFGSEPASNQIVVFLIGARNNHPLGLLAPGWKQIGAFFEGMIAELEALAEEYDYLGSSGWTDGSRATNNEVMTVCYFRTAEGIHKYAHGTLHREAWNWWNESLAQHLHIGIWHELFVAPKGHWETIYVNSKPLLMGATVFPVEKEWVSPIVDASRGVLRTSRGRMTMSEGNDNEKYGDEPYVV